MLTLETAQSLSSIIVFVTAYICSVCIAGYFASWVALKVGDTTAYQEGYLSLDPLMHIDIVGLIFLILCNFGWGRLIPFDATMVNRPYRKLKLIAMYGSESFAHWVLSFAATFLLFIIFGKNSLFALYKPLPEIFTHSSSYLLAVGAILVSFSITNIMLCLVTQLINSNNILVNWFVDRYPTASLYARLLILLIPVLLYIALGGFLIKLLLVTTWFLAYNCALLFI